MEMSPIAVDEAHALGIEGELKPTREPRLGLIVFFLYPKKTFGLALFLFISYKVKRNFFNLFAAVD
jgi:hypothetical protein